MDISQISDQLDPSPKRFPDCCLGISSTLLTYLGSNLPKTPAFTLSVGSGSGLLEALIVRCNENVSVEGVEVNSTVNRYIAEEAMNIVGGGWGLCSDAQMASAWMFVYPRDPKLITKYMNTYGDQAVESIVWLGPKADWPVFEPCFRQSSFSELSFLDAGIAPYETAVIARKAS
ncbi:hypothetical protein N7476_009022 [Penicillium atrosanguineum]|uniref:Uncharacterized protein n=1 Tax=Penicillium atrosanguineum TaxID=1132637 RepID=A0A9W9PSS5_9EURO|nr:hypothetical protein N7526_002230 [Penicillium atrosanguineum]KAJ5308366.1 hypothetical protein N7476_009022 [Penicillium atrosanguineum]